jgi:hypothetical protein
MIGSAAGATSLFACGGCVAGFGGRDCQPCPPNTYSAGEHLEGLMFWHFMLQLLRF